MGLAQNRGAAGEDLAAAYLDLIGYAITARNTKLGGVEVDLVALDGECRVLVEVKYRGRGDYGGAALAVDWAKRQRLLRAAQAAGGQGGSAMRIDVVAIERSEDGAIVRHYRDAVSE